jgi:CRISPR-associated protein Csx17
VSDPDADIDWEKTTFEGSRREQLRHWRSLSVRERLEALDRLSQLTNPLPATSGKMPGAKP